MFIELSRYLTHLIIATLGAGVLGLVPFLLLASFFKEPILLAALLAGVSLGYVVNRKRPDKSAMFVWIIPLLVLIYIILEEKSHFSQSWAGEAFPLYIWNTFFGMNCGASECLYEVFFSAPMLSSVSYSLAAGFALMRSTSNETISA